MLLLAAAHRGPPREGRQGVRAALLVVAREAPQQAVVRGGDPREVVHGHRREARDVDAELLRVGDRGGQTRVQSVNPLDDQDRAVVERQRRAVLRAPSRDEVVARDVDAFAGHQPPQVVVEQVEVDGFERLVVVVSVFVERGLLAVDEVVVQGDHHRVQPQHAQLDAQPFGRGGLAARRGARDQHHPDAPFEVGLLDGVGDLGEFPFVERLGDLDHAAGVARKGAGVDRTDRRDAHERHPRLVLPEDAEHLLLPVVPVEAVGCRARRQHEVETLVAGFDVEQVDVSRRGGQRSVEVSGRVAQRVEVAVKPRPGVEQFDLVGEPLLGIAFADLGGGHPLPGDRQVQGDEFADPVADPLRPGPGEFGDALDLAVEAALTQRVADVERLARIEVLDGLLQQEPHRALVDADAGERRDVDEMHRGRGVYLVVQLLDAVVDEGRQKRMLPGGELSGDLRQRGAHRNVERFAEVFTNDWNGVVHRNFLHVLDSKDRNNLYF